jgi:endonuclease/exonuclease/phosphatase family metal-dependent hydrolase
MALLLVSYNVLADCYIDPTFYPGTPPAALDPAQRWPRLLDRLQGLAAEVLCLQEVETPLFEHLQSKLSTRGYGARHALKRGRPDGCATFFGPALQLASTTPLHYADADASGRDSGHLALLTVLDGPFGRFGVANTHFKWDLPARLAAEHWAFRQASQLVAHLGREGEGLPWVVCGDFNVLPDSDVLRLLQAAGLVDAYRHRPAAFTCNSNRRAKRIDFILHSAALQSDGLDGQRWLGDETVMPSADEPSDHLPIGAWLAPGAEATRGPKPGLLSIP